jgi:hypothetical protein
MDVGGFPAAVIVVVETKVVFIVVSILGIAAVEMITDLR